MSPVYIPAQSASDWQRLLAKPELHWKSGRSARALAHCWQEAESWPGSFGSALAAAGLDLEVVLALPSTGSLSLAASPSEGSLAAIAVEAKVSEPFGERVGDWRGEDGGREKRLAFLLDTLGLTEDPAVASLRCLFMLLSTGSTSEPRWPTMQRRRRTARRRSRTPPSSWPRRSDSCTPPVSFERAHGETWAGVGERLGVARQAAHERFAVRR